MTNAILPVLLIIALGVAIRRYGWLPPAFFPAIEKFSYNICFPALLFSGTARLSFRSAQVAELALATLLPTVLVALATLLALWPARALPAASRSSVVQGAVRPNTYFGIAVSSLLFAPPTAALVMLSLALCLPLVNVIAVMALSWWSGVPPRPGRIARNLAANPIIQSTLAGMLWSLAGWPLPAPLFNTLDILGKAALCLGLICVGSGLVFSLQGLRPLALSLSSVFKLLLLPLLAAKVCVLCALSAPVALAACFYCALPTAPNAYIMARQMGGDTRLMAALITLQTLLAAVTLPLSGQFLQWLA